MDTNNLLTEAKEKFEKVISFLEDELKKVRGILDYLVGEVSESLKEALNELNFTS